MIVLCTAISRSRDGAGDGDVGQNFDVVADQCEGYLYENCECNFPYKKRTSQNWTPLKHNGRTASKRTESAAFR